MKLLNAPIHLSPVLGIVLIVLIVGLLFWRFMVLTGKMIFNEKLDMLKGFIVLSNVNEENCKKIDAMFQELTWHNEIQHDKKRKLWREFMIKFYEVSKYKLCR
jgi:hypothetical protein